MDLSPEEYKQFTIKKHTEYFEKKNRYLTEYRLLSGFYTTLKLIVEITASISTIISSVLIIMGFPDILCLISLLSAAAILLRMFIKKTAISKFIDKKYSLYLKAMECELKVWTFYLDAMSDDKYSKREFKKFLKLNYQLEKELADMEEKTEHQKEKFHAKASENNKSDSEAGNESQVEINN